MWWVDGSTGRLECFPHVSMHVDPSCWSDSDGWLFRINTGVRVESLFPPDPLIQFRCNVGAIHSAHLDGFHNWWSLAHFWPQHVRNNPISTPQDLHRGFRRIQLWSDMLIQLLIHFTDLIVDKFVDIGHDWWGTGWNELGQEGRARTSISTSAFLFLCLLFMFSFLALFVLHCCGSAINSSRFYWVKQWRPSVGRVPAFISICIILMMILFRFMYLSDRVWSGRTVLFHGEPNSSNQR